MRLSFLALALICFITNVLAQKNIEEIDVVDLSWFNDNPYASDSSVHAYVITQKTDVRLELNAGGSFSRRTTIRRIVRVLDPIGYDQATFRFRFFDPKSGGGSYKITALKAITYNRESDDLERSVLADEDIYKNRLTSDLSELSFSFPNVKEGSILDLVLEFVSFGNPDIPNAILQEGIPIQEIEHQFRAHEYFKFQTTTHGYFPVEAVRTKESTRDPRVEGVDNLITIKASNVPALKREPFISSLNNFAAHCKFELISFYVPGYETLDLAGDWEQIVGNVLGNRNLSEAIKGKGRYKDWALKLPDSISADHEKAAWALQEVNNLIRWNGYHSPWAENKASVALAKREGNTGDINTLLLGLSNALGLESYPVLMSSQDNGWLLEFNPVQSSINNILVATQIDEELLFSDASQEKAVFGILPKCDLNGKGILIKKGRFSFIDLHNGAIKQQNIQARLTLTEEGFLSGNITFIIKGQSVLDVLAATDESTIADLEALGLSDLFILSEVVIQKESINSIAIKLEIESKEAILKIGNAFVLDPYLVKFQEINPFTIEKRMYPIEFQTKILEAREITINLPQRIHLEELPKPVFATTSDRKALYRHVIKETETGIHLTTVFAVKQLLFLPEAYPEIQGLFSVIEENESTLLSLVPKL